MTSLFSTLHGLAHEAAGSPEADTRALAVKAVRKLGSANLRELAIREITDWIDRTRRAAAREVEQAATRTQAKVSVRRLLASVDRTSDYEEWLADPSILDWARKSQVSDSGRQIVLTNAAERKRFLRWLGDRYHDWYARGCASAEKAAARGEYEGRNESTYFECDFYEFGSREWIMWRRMERIQSLVAEVVAETRLEVTAELLATVFALGDGTKVTWGAATVEQHEQRVAMLTKNVSGIIETAALHEKAIDMIRDAGVACLADLPDQPAVMEAAA